MCLQQVRLYCGLQPVHKEGGGKQHRREDEEVQKLHPNNGPALAEAPRDDAQGVEVKTRQSQEDDGERQRCDGQLQVVRVFKEDLELAQQYAAQEANERRLAQDLIKIETMRI